MLVTPALQQCLQAVEEKDSVEGFARLHETVRALVAEEGGDRDEAAQDSVPPAEQAGRDLVEWLRREGGFVHPALQLRRCGEAGNGFVAEGAVERGAELFRVPMSCIISEATVLAHPVLSQLQAQLSVLKQFASPLFALFLLVERGRGEASRWRVYLASLPLRFSVPLYWSWEELQLLQGSPAWTQAQQQWKNAVRLYAVVRHVCSQNLAALGLPAAPTFVQWRWALSAVVTRRNSVPVSENASLLALIPVWDMCNHRSAGGEVMTGFDENAQQVLCRAMHTAAPGEQVYIFYGARSHADLLVHNGFLPDDDGDEPGAADYFLVRLSLNANDPLFAEKKRLAQRHKLPATGDFALRLFGPAALVLTFARIARLQAGEIGAAEAAETAQPLSRANEDAACELLGTAVAIALKKTQLAVAGAERDGGGSYARQCALRLRRMEEAMMRGFLEQLAEYRKTLK
jgi:hypothetical protein